MKRYRQQLLPFTINLFILISETNLFLLIFFFLVLYLFLSLCFVGVLELTYNLFFYYYFFIFDTNRSKNENQAYQTNLIHLFSLNVSSHFNSIQRRMIMRILIHLAKTASTSKRYDSDCGSCHQHIHDYDRAHPNRQIFS